MTDPAHLSRKELERWWTHGDPASRARIVSHLADCDACGARYAELIDQRPPHPADLAPAPRDLVRRAYRLYRRSRPPAAWWPRRWVLAGAAAAILAVAVAVPALRGPAAPVVDDGRIRGSALQALSPIGVVQPPIRFRWASPIAAARYTVEVRDAAGALLVTLSSDAEIVVLPADRQAELTPGQPYTWQVVATTAAGEEIMRSPPRSFVVSP